MRRAFLLLLLFLSAGFMQAQDFAQLVDKVHAAPESRRQYLVDSFLTLVGSFPHIENDSSVYMLYLGNATGVFLAGDANGWSAKTSPLTRLSTTNLWYREERYEADARLDYKIVVDDRWLLDPRNPYTVSGGYGPNSELRMPSYIPPSEIIPNNVASRGTLVDTSVSSTALGNLRPIRIYLPPGYDQGSDRYPVALFHDGMNYLTLAHAATVLDNLIHEGRIPPVIAVFIPPVDPTSEYAGNKLEAFCSFVVQEIMPAIDRGYRTRMEPSARAVIGAANGGNCALYMAMRYPGIFGNVAAQSSYIINEIFSTFQDGDMLPLRRMYLDLGTYDLPVLKPLVRGFIPILQTRGYEYRYQEFHEGHSWGNWRSRIDDILIYLFNNLATTAPDPPAPAAGIRIHDIAPNPAHDFVRVSFENPQSANVRVLLHDRSGRLLRHLPPRMLASGEQQLLLDLSGIPSGLHFVTLLTSSSLSTVPLSVR